MDEMGKWFMDVFTSINRGGRLGPQVASCKRVGAFLEQVGGEGVIHLSTLLNIGNTEAVRRLAASKPDLGEWLSGVEPQKSLDAYFEERVNYFEPCRKIFTRCLSLPAGNTELNFVEPVDSESAEGEAWGKVFQLLTVRGNDDQESSDL